MDAEDTRSETSITISLPYPPRELSPNGRCYFLKKNKLAQQYKAIAKVAARYQKPKGHKPWEKAESIVVYFQKRRQKMDDDNALATLKSAMDGIVLAGVLVDDKYLSHQKPRFEVDKENPRVEITIQPTP